MYIKAPVGVTPENPSVTGCLYALMRGLKNLNYLIGI